jgi:DNA-binding CsgD family transcriptional regulator
VSLGLAHPPLVGREEEQRLLEALLDTVTDRGQALVLRGEAGIGKSRLLAEAARMAHDRGMIVLTTTGVQSEAHLPFAGLHQLLRSVRGRARDLPSVQRTALDAAFGATDVAAPEHFRIAMAALDLLSEVAAEAPLLLVADDTQWLDRPTAEALAFIARRIESDPILLLAAARTGYASVLGVSGVPEHDLAAFNDTAAAVLLDAATPGLPTAKRTRVLREAAGNPLALIELPAAVKDDAWTLGAVPLTARLEHAFAARVSELPEPTRRVLLVAALNDENSLDEILRAADADLAAVAPAVSAGVVEADLQTIRFRHPLIRSALTQRADLADRRQAHAALAEVLADQPDRRAWHRAALVFGEHEDLATELEEAGVRAQRRGATPVAVAALSRAAELGEPAGRSRRLLAAAELAVELGQPDVIEPLLRSINRLALGDIDQGRAAWVQETARTAPLDDAERFAFLISAADRAGAAGDGELQINLLWLVASRAWWADPGPGLRELLTKAAHRLDDADPRVLAIYAYADPWGNAARVLDRLPRATASDGDAARFLGPAALVVGAFDLGAEFLAATVDGLRADGRLVHLPRLLTLHGRMAAHLADWDTAVTAADEARRLAEELGQPLWAAAADTVTSLVAAMRGDEDAAERLAEQAELVVGPAGVNISMAFAQFGKVLAALATGRHADAYASATRVFEPGDPAYHPVVSAWLLADLADAARHIGRLDDARARVAEVEAAAGDTPGTWIALNLAHARALVADRAQAGGRFEAALANDLTRWPFQRARIQLAYGQWLRRDRRVAESRTVLRAARDTFDALGCATWGEQARRDLRASGERSRRRTPEARDDLTAQELQIARLAAQGLSNREIGQRLFLSHRTISTHLYRVFPKLGITSRAGLAAALSHTYVDDDRHLTHDPPAVSQQSPG